jgi:hypothetical protein
MIYIINLQTIITQLITTMLFVTLNQVKQLGWINTAEQQYPGFDMLLYEKLAVYGCVPRSLTPLPST